VKQLTILTTIVFMTISLMACNQNQPAKPAAKASAVAEKKQPVPIPSPEAAQPAPASTESHTGKVLETMNTAGYTYVYVDTGVKKIWAAAPEFSVAVGDEVMVPAGMAMNNYHSQTLERDFKLIYFVESVLNASSPTMAAGSAGSAQMPAGHPNISNTTPTEIDLTNIAKADGGMTIAEVYAGKADLADKNVTLRGKVVKFSPQIMKTNWIHIQDGSGDAKSGTNDLTVTSDASVKIGDTIVVSGTLTLDKDFGYGYQYDLIMEGAAVTAE